MELIKREDENSKDKRFYAYSNGGKKYSVINIGAIMATAPYFTNKEKEELFNGWEAMEIKDDELLVDNCFRAKTWEELQKFIESE